MLNRRSFFRRLAGAVAIIVLAPEIAFKAPLRVTERMAEPISAYWVQTWRHSRLTDAGYQAYMEEFVKVHGTLRIMPGSRRSGKTHAALALHRWQTSEFLPTWD